MYKIASVTLNEIGKIKIRNQNKIVELTGTKLNLLQAFAVIKNESSDFTIDNEKAKKADQLFSELLQREGISINKIAEQENSNNNSNKVRIKEQERSRALELLKLKLSLAA